MPSKKTDSEIKDDISEKVKERVAKELEKAPAPVVLGRENQIRLGVAISIAMFCGFLLWNTFENRASTKAAIVELQHQIERLTDKIDTKMSGRWSKDDMERFSVILAAKNPALDIDSVMDLFR